jgi:Ca2+/H+ antiporter
VVAFIASIVILALGVGICLFVGSRRPIGTPVTWGEAMVAGTFVFALMLVAYGVVPHQWLTYADNALLWRADKLLVGVSSAGVAWGDKAKSLGGAGRIQVNYQALRDIVAATLYIVFLGGQMYLWSIWQKRGRKTPELDTTSRFGRPVIRKA